MMNVGLVTDSSSRPRPMAMPRASTVFPAPSSPQSAMTSPGCACAAMRSPSRSVWSEEWLTRSIAPGSACARPLGMRCGSAAFTDEPNAKAHERAEDDGPDPHVPRPRQAEELQAGIAAERSGERHQAEEPDGGPHPLQPGLAGQLRPGLALAPACGPLLPAPLNPDLFAAFGCS